MADGAMLCCYVVLDVIGKGGGSFVEDTGSGTSLVFEGMSKLFLVGAGLSVVGSIFSNFGVNVQKYSHMREEKLVEEGEKKRTYLKQPLWVLGFSFVLFGSLFDFAALAFAAQSMVATVGSITLVANLFFAHLWLKEELTPKDVMATLLVLGGSAIAILFGATVSDTDTLDELKENYRRWKFIIYVISVGGCSLLAWSLIRVAQPYRDRMLEANREYHKAVKLRERKHEIRELDSAIKQMEASYEKYARYHPVCYCFLAGAFGAQTLIFAKSVAQLIRVTVGAGENGESGNQFAYPLTYVFIAGMLTCIALETHFLATGLKYFDALYIVPVFQCFFITLGAVSGGLFFDEFSGLSTTQAIVFPVGVAVTLCGVYMLSSRNMDVEDDRPSPPMSPSVSARSLSNGDSCESSPSLSGVPSRPHSAASVHMNHRDPILEVVSLEDGELLPARADSASPDALLRLGVQEPGDGVDGVDGVDPQLHHTSDSGLLPQPSNTARRSSGMGEGALNLTPANLATIDQQTEDDEKRAHASDIDIVATSHPPQLVNGSPAIASPASSVFDFKQRDAIQRQLSSVSGQLFSPSFVIFSQFMGQMVKSKDLENSARYDARHRRPPELLDPKEYMATIKRWADRAGSGMTSVFDSTSSQLGGLFSGVDRAVRRRRNRHRRSRSFGSRGSVSQGTSPRRQHSAISHTRSNEPPLNPFDDTPHSQEAPTVVRAESAESFDGYDPSEQRPQQKLQRFPIERPNKTPMTSPLPVRHLDSAYATDRGERSGGHADQLPHDGDLSDLSRERYGSTGSTPRAGTPE